MDNKQQIWLEKARTYFHLTQLIKNHFKIERMMYVLLVLIIFGSYLMYRVIGGYHEKELLAIFMWILLYGYNLKVAYSYGIPFKWNCRVNKVAMETTADSLLTELEEMGHEWFFGKQEQNVTLNTVMERLERQWLMGTIQIDTERYHNNEDYRDDYLEYVYTRITQTLILLVIYYLTLSKVDLWYFMFYCVLLLPILRLNTLLEQNRVESCITYRIGTKE